MYYVYIIQNDIGNIYIGQTVDLEKRLLRHNRLLTSKKSSYTKQGIGTWKIIYKEQYRTRKEALLREKYLKSHVGRDWIRVNIRACSSTIYPAAPDF